MDAVVVYVTAPDTDTAAGIARSLVQERLAACGNVVPGLRSIYSWQGEVHDESEVLLILKTRAERVDDLAARVVALHPYDLPEVIALPVSAGLPAYLQWVGDNVAPAEDA